MAVTEVSTGFGWRDTPAGRVLVARALDPIAPHLFTTRDVNRSDTPDYRAIAASLGKPPDSVVWVRQVHGRGVVLVQPGDAFPDPPPEADALVSFESDRVVVVRVADCVPVLMADRQRRAVAAVHAGWRGIAAGAIGAAVETLARHGIGPAEVVAAVGPSIGPCCYQVDTVVREALLKRWPDGERWFGADGSGRWKLDLWTAARDQLLDAGVPAEAIPCARACTFHNPNDWWSYRRDAAAAGRMVAAITHVGPQAPGPRPQVFLRT